MGTYPPFYAYPSAPPVVRAVPDPPRLHWAWLLVLSIVTFGFFGSVWMIVQANWVRKVRGRSRTLPWAIANASALPALFLFALVMGALGAAYQLENTQTDVAIAVEWARVIMGALWLITIYMLHNELSEHPISIPLSGVATFFFGPIYFQYHLYDYEVSDEVHQFRGPLRTELETPPESSVSEA
jgi:preprotein translocase subunit SecY